MYSLSLNSSHYFTVMIFWNLQLFQNCKHISNSNKSIVITCWDIGDVIFKLVNKGKKGRSCTDKTKCLNNGNYEYRIDYDMGKILMVTFNENNRWNFPDTIWRFDAKNYEINFQIDIRKNREHTVSLMDYNAGWLLQCSMY